MKIHSIAGNMNRELKDLFLSRQTTLGPIPLVMLIGYFTSIGLAIFRPKFRKTELSHSPE